MLWSAFDAGFVVSLEIFPLFVLCAGALKFDISEVGSGSTNGASFNKPLSLSLSLLLLLLLFTNWYVGEL